MKKECAYGIIKEDLTKLKNVKIKMIGKRVKKVKDIRTLKDCVECKNSKHIIRNILVFEKQNKSYLVYVIIQGYVIFSNGLFTDRLDLCQIEEKDADKYYKLFSPQFDHIEVIDNETKEGGK